MGNKTLLLLGILIQSPLVLGADQQHVIMGTGSIATVGPGNCTFDTTDGGSLTGAITQGFTEVRLVNNVIHEGNQTINYSMSIMGGFDSCTDANNNIGSSTPSVIDANQQGSVLRLEGLNEDFLLQNITLSGGANTDFGGGLMLAVQSSSPSAVSTVTMDNVTINGNIANIGGGGIFKQASSFIDLIIKDSTINNNLADTGAGGGINFQGFGSFLMYGNSEVSNNLGPKGGGIFFRDTQATLVAGDNATPTAGVSSNTATLVGGGGLWIEDSEVDIIGGLYRLDAVTVVGNTDEMFPVRLNALDGGGVGAGIYVTTNSNFRASGLDLSNNQYFGSTGFDGLALYSKGSDVLIGSPFQSEFEAECNFGALKQGCNLISDHNSAITTGELVFSQESTLILERTEISHNEIADQLLTSLSDDLIIFQNNVVFDNTMLSTSFNSLLSLNNFLDATVTQNTVINNEADFAVFSANANNSPNIAYNYWYNPNVTDWFAESSSSAPATRTCNLADEINNSADPNQDEFVVNANFHLAQFVDLINRDLHLRDDADLVDFGLTHCGTVPPAVSSHDIDNQPRTNAPDIGADENLINDFIFIDGFDSSI